jgi:hypothetical protein
MTQLKLIVTNGERLQSNLRVCLYRDICIYSQNQYILSLIVFRYEHR